MNELIFLSLSKDAMKYLDSSLLTLFKGQENKWALYINVTLESHDPNWQKILEACNAYYRKTYKSKKRRFTKMLKKEQYESIKYINDYWNDLSKEKGWHIQEIERGYSGAYFIRKYSEKEIEKSELLLFIPTYISTTMDSKKSLNNNNIAYDRSNECDYCRANKIQINNLTLNLLKMPKTKDIVNIFATDEIIINKRFVDLLENNNITGYQLRDVHHSINTKKTLKPLYQLIISGQIGDIAKQTKYGYDPFHIDEKLESLCPKCKKSICTNNIQSELYLYKKNWTGSDIALTTTLIGGGPMLGFPKPFIIISQRFYQLLKKFKLKGYKVEVVNLL